MLMLLRTVGWIACVVYSTIPAFWLLIHPSADYWRSRRRSPYLILVPVLVAMWVLTGVITARWRGLLLYENEWTWIPAGVLFFTGLLLYKVSHNSFSLTQLGGLPEILPNQSHQHLVTSGIRAHVRHPVYLGHFCEMLAWSLGTGLVVCWCLTAFAVVSGSIMIRLEDAELEKRFGHEYRRYRSVVPAILPVKINKHTRKSV